MESVNDYYWELNIFPKSSIFLKKHFIFISKISPVFKEIKKCIKNIYFKYILC